MKSVIGKDVFIVKFAYKVAEKNAKCRKTTCYFKHGPVKNKEIISERIVEETVRNIHTEPFIRAKGRKHAFFKALSTLFSNPELHDQFNLTGAHYRQLVNDFYEQCATSRQFKDAN